MFTKKQIDQWILIGSSGDNCDVNHIFANRSNITSIKRDLVEMKVQIDRWNLITSDFIFNSTAKKFIRENLKNDLKINKNGPDKIWGNNIHYIDEMPYDKVLAIDLNNIPITNRNIALFEFNLSYIEKTVNLTSKIKIN